ncbi:hypothetical protein D3C75_840590 [compost metagenome]
MVVPGVTDCNGFGQLAAEVGRQELQRQSLGAFMVHDLQEMRLGFGNVHGIAQQPTQNRRQLIQEIGIVDDQHFWCFLRDKLLPIRLDIIFSSVKGGVVDQLLVLFTGIQLVINIGLQVQVMLHAVVEQLAYGILRHITLVEHFFIHQVLYECPLVSDDRHIQSGLAGDGLGGSIGASGSQSNHNACGNGLFQRCLCGRGNFLVIINQGVVNIDCNQFVHVGSLLKVL